MSAPSFSDFLPCQRNEGGQHLRVQDLKPINLSSGPHLGLKKATSISGSVLSLTFLLAIQLQPAALAATATPTPTPSSSQRIVAVKWRPPASGPAPLGYKLYWGGGSGNYQNTKDVKNVLTYSLTLQKAFRYFIAARAYTTSGESDFSNEVVLPPSQ